MFSLEGADCLSCLWAKARGSARCSSSNRVISSVILAPPVYQSSADIFTRVGQIIKEK